MIIKVDMALPPTTLQEIEKARYINVTIQIIINRVMKATIRNIMKSFVFFEAISIIFVGLDAS